MDGLGKGAIRELALRWLDDSGITQKDLAQKMDIAAASLNQMLTGIRDFPLLRFLQIVHLLKPSDAEIDRAFEIYYREVNIPPGDLRLVLKRGAGLPGAKATRGRIHAMVDRIADSKLDVVEAMLKGLTDE